MDQLKPPSELKFSGRVADNWKRFKQVFGLYFLAIGADSKLDTQKIAIFLTVAGNEAVYVYNTFQFTEEEKDKYDKLIQKFDAYCYPKQNETNERYVFRSRHQREGESIEQWVIDLTNMTQNCNFGTLRDGMIRDQIVIGTIDVKVKESLLRETDLTFDKAVQICQAAETASRQIKALGAELPDSCAINAVGYDRKPRRDDDRENDRQRNSATTSAPTPPNTTPMKKPCHYCGQKHPRKKMEPSQSGV